MSESVISFAGREQGQPAMPHSVCGVNHNVLPLVDKALHTPNPHYTPPSVVFLDPEAKQVLTVVTYEREFATLNDHEEESKTRRLGTGGAFDPHGAG
jgi:hypothetical protein